MVVAIQSFERRRKFTSSKLAAVPNSRDLSFRRSPNLRAGIRALFGRFLCGLGNRGRLLCSTPFDSFQNIRSLKRIDYITKLAKSPVMHKSAAIYVP